MTTTRSDLDPRAPGLTLRRAWQIFVKQASVKIVFTLALAVFAVRLAVGELSWGDAVVVAILCGIHPLTEWLIHVYVLHFKPRNWLGRKLDFRIARDHRFHHYAPHDPRYWFIPVPSGLLGLGMMAVAFFVLLPTWRLSLTALGAACALALFYEWTHYLCHTTYKPRTKLYRRLAQLHRLHHFKNEHYWMGVTMHSGDRLLGTLPEPNAVETSMTCRTLLNEK